MPRKLACLFRRVFYKGANLALFQTLALALATFFCRVFDERCQFGTFRFLATAGSAEDRRAALG
jgi:hypothetical protein